MIFKQDTEETPVIFRIPRGKQMAELDGVTAYFPAEPFDLYGRTITCYAHVGQHGGADPFYALHRTRLATPAEYQDLKDELESAYGYRLKVVAKRTKAHRDACKRQVAEWRRLDSQAG